MAEIIPYKPGMEISNSYATTYRVYVLKNPINDEIFYVGVTSKPLKHRLNGHMGGLKNKPTAKNEYILRLVEAGHKPIIEEIEVISATCYIHRAYALHRELYWIRHHKEQNLALTNGTGFAPCKTEYDAYQEKINAGETEWKYYLCGTLPDGRHVYDIEALSKDGFRLPAPPPKPEPEPSYKPFENQRFLEKLVKGGAPTSFGYVWLDYTAYKDDDPDWYEQDNCTLFGY